MFALEDAATLAYREQVVTALETGLWAVVFSAGIIVFLLSALLVRRL